MRDPIDEPGAPLEEGLPDDVAPLPEDADVPTMEDVAPPEDLETDEPPDLPDP